MEHTKRNVKITFSVSYHLKKTRGDLNMGLKHHYVEESRWFLMTDAFVKPSMCIQLNPVQPEQHGLSCGNTVQTSLLLSVVLSRPP